MALELQVTGPGLDLSRRLEPGEPALILGRDTDCSICLHDSERNVSRRHLSVWNQGDQLHFHVLSVVNGVQIDGGELPPGARGVLRAGELMVLSAFRLRAVAVEEAATLPAPLGAGDPWAEFERQAAELVPSGPDTVPFVDDEDDPFGDWDFRSTFGAGSPGADAMAPATDLHAFFAGLGLDPSAQKSLTQGELETIGRLTRIALQALLQAFATAAAQRQDLRVDDRATAEPRERNPLRLDTALQDKLYYLFGGQAAAEGLLPPDRAVAQVASELAAHQQALADAVRETLQGVVREFDPEVLKKRLLGGGARIFESARAWEAFSKDYAERVAAQPPWVQQLLDRHFAIAYVRALLRAKRNTPGRPGG